MRRFINSLHAFLKKELNEGLRTKKFLILAIGILFFAVADPVFLKLMPEILKNQMQGADLSALIELSQKAAMQNYVKDLHQLVTMIIVFSLMGIVAGERMDKTLTIPAAMGCSKSSVIISKTLVYGTFLFALSIMGMSIAYMYSGLIFEPGFTSFSGVMVSGILFGFFFIFVTSTLVFMSSLFKKAFIGGIGTLLIVYLMPLLDMVFSIGKFLPTYLIEEAGRFNSHLPKETTVAVLCTIVLIILINTASVVRLNRVELV